MDLAVRYHKHFRVKNRRAVSCCCFKIEINSKWDICQIFKIILKIYYLTVIKSIGYSFPCYTNKQMFSHDIIGLGKEIFTVMTLFNSTITNVLFSFIKPANIASISQVNFVCEKTLNWIIFVKHRLIDHVNRLYVYPFVAG